MLQPLRRLPKTLPVSALRRKTPARPERRSPPAPPALLPPAPPVRPAHLPAWYPIGFDWTKAVEGASRILRAQGEPVAALAPGSCRALTFTDFDHTITQSGAPIALRRKTRFPGEPEELLRDPRTGHLVMLGVERSQWVKDYEALRAALPEIDWDDYEPDFREAGSLVQTLKAKEVPQSIELLRASGRGADRRNIVVTARQEDRAIHAVAEYFKVREIPLAATFAVWTQAHGETLGLDRAPLNTGQRKALTMAAILKLYAPTGNEVRQVRFLEDDDDNLRAAMQLLPRMFPEMSFEFVDVIHRGAGIFEHATVARAEGGVLRKPDGARLTADELAAYRSPDVRLPPEYPQPRAAA